jgi:hypothetical protein
MVNYGVHPLDGSFEREWWAGEHLRDLELEISRVFERQANAVPFDLDPKAPHGAINIRLPPETFFGMRIGILVGEICYNLRSALDYLIFELAKLDSGVEQRGTQFPIMDAKQDFDGRGKSAFSQPHCGTGDPRSTGSLRLDVWRASFRHQRVAPRNQDVSAGDRSSNHCFLKVKIAFRKVRL